MSESKPNTNSSQRSEFFGPLANAALYYVLVGMCLTRGQLPARVAREAVQRWAELAGIELTEPERQVLIERLAALPDPGPEPKLRIVLRVPFLPLPVVAPTQCPVRTGGSR